MDDQTLIATPPEPKSSSPSSPEPKPDIPTPQAPKSNRNLIIGIVVAIVLCCCCIVTGIAGYYGYQAYTAAQQAVEQFEEFEVPEIPTDVPFEPNQAPQVTGEAPEGGLADEPTRYNAWLAVQLVGIITGCETPTVQGTTIEVTQQPDSSGVWVEQWNVNCGNGNTEPFKVTFTPENGIVNVNVEIP